MSKDFETEYKALATHEAPDLWARIEAGIASETLEDVREDNTKSVDITMTASSEFAVLKEKIAESKAPEKGNTEQGRTSGRRVSFIKKYRPAFIAAICLIVVLPAVVVLGQMEIIGGGKSMESAAECETESMAIADTIANETVEAPAACEAEGAMVTESAMTEAAMAESAMTEAAEAEEDESDGGAMEKMQAEALTDEAPAETIVDQYAAETLKEEAKAEAEQKNSPTIADGTVLEHVNIRIDIEEVMKEAMSSQASKEGAVYRVEIVKDENGILEEGEEILLFVPEGTFELTVLYQEEKKRTYEVAIEYDSRREYPFYLKEGK